MTLAPTPAYDDLVALHQRLHHLGHLGAIAGWDQAANMPPKGNEARAAALAELHGLFWNAPDHALVSRAAVSAGLDLSILYLEKLAIEGTGPAFEKCGQRGRVYYRKADVLAWHATRAQRMTSTRDYRRPCPDAA